MRHDYGQGRRTRRIAQLTMDRYCVRVIHIPGSILNLGGLSAWKGERLLVGSNASEG